MPPPQSCEPYEVTGREPNARGYNWGTLFLALLVGRVSEETEKYGYWFCVTRTIG
jgi:hypothetical protein